MRQIAIGRLQQHPNVDVLDGSFEQMPLTTASVDYLYSILAFHWTTDLERAVDEIGRVLKLTGEMDLVFIGRHNGQDFIKQTTPLFLKHLGLAGLVESARLRKQLSIAQAVDLFSKKFSGSGFTVEESYETYYDSLEGHWSWWVRIEGQLLNLPPDKKADCDREVRKSLSALTTDKGIPYTAHLLHVRLRRG